MKLAKLTSLTALGLGLALHASATTIDFESTAGGVYNTLNFSGLTITAEDGRFFDVTNSGSPGWPISNNALITFFQNESIQTKLIATFSAKNVTSFSIGVGDYNADVDNTFLEVYDASWNLLGSDSYVNPAATFGGDYLSVTTNSAIKYAVFWDAEPFPGAVYWDNLTHNGTSAVPDSSSAAVLLGLGLSTLALMRRKLAN